jgi:hypothetical protein
LPEDLRFERERGQAAQAAFARLKADQSAVDRARCDFLPRIAATIAFASGASTERDTLGARRGRAAIIASARSAPPPPPDCASWRR